MALETVFSLVLVLLACLLMVWLARLTGLPEALLVLLTGALLHEVVIGGRPLVLVPLEVIAVFAFLARVFLTFEMSVLASHHPKDWLLVFAEIAIMSVAGKFILEMNWWFAVLFGSLVVATALHGRGALIERLNRHAAITNVLAAVVPWLVLDAFAGLEEGALLPFGTHLAYTSGGYLLGIGVGVFTAFILMRILKHTRDWYAYIAVLVGILVAYFLADALQGSGILAVIALGVFFGTSTVRNKVRLFKFEGHVATVLLIITFAFLGFVVKFDAGAGFLLKVLLLFLVLVLLRFVAFHGTLSERLFCAFHAGPGVVSVTVMLALILDPATGGLALPLRAVFVMTVLSLFSQLVTSFISRIESVEKPL